MQGRAIRSAWGIRECMTTDLTLRVSANELQPFDDTGPGRRGSDSGEEKNINDPDREKKGRGRRRLGAELVG